MDQRHLEGKLEELKYEANHINVISPKPCYDEDFRRYRDLPDDPRWRIRPDPDVVVTKADILMQALEAERRKSRVSRVTIHNMLSAGMMLFQEPSAPNYLIGLSSEESDRDSYKDYPKLYFGIEEPATSAAPQPVPE